MVGNSRVVMPAFGTVGSFLIISAATIETLRSTGHHICMQRLMSATSQIHVSQTLREFLKSWRMVLKGPTLPPRCMMSSLTKIWGSIERKYKIPAKAS